MTSPWWAGLALASCAVVACGADPTPAAPACNATGALESRPKATAAEVGPILARSCAIGGCHLSAPGAGGLVLDANAPSAMVGAPSKQNTAMPLVTAGDPERSWLVTKLRRPFCATGCAQGCGGTMPPGEPVSAAELAIIVGWIEGGAR